MTSQHPSVTTHKHAHKTDLIVWSQSTKTAAERVPPASLPNHVKIAIHSFSLKIKGTMRIASPNAL